MAFFHSSNCHLVCQNAINIWIYDRCCSCTHIFLVSVSFLFLCSHSAVFVYQYLFMKQFDVFCLFLFFFCFFLFLLVCCRLLWYITVHFFFIIEKPRPLRQLYCTSQGTLCVCSRQHIQYIAWCTVHSSNCAKEKYRWLEWDGKKHQFAADDKNYL